MDNTLRHSLADRAFLFDDPDAYLAGVDAALQALTQSESDRTAPTSNVHPRRAPAPDRERRAAHRR